MWNYKKVNKPNKNKHTDPKSRVEEFSEGRGRGWAAGKRADTVMDGMRFLVISSRYTETDI